MKPSRLVLEMKGLVTAPGQLAVAPGALTTAANVDFPAPGMCVKRKGFVAAKEQFTGPCYAAASTKQLGSNILFHASGAGGSQLQYSDGNALITTIATPDGTSFAGVGVAQRMKAAVSLKNHYLTSVRAMARLQSNYTLHWAGMARPPGAHWTQQTVAQLNASATWLANAFAVAYRVVWVMKDADGVEIVSAPSGRWVVANVSTTSGYSGGAARGVTLHVGLPFQSDTTVLVTSSWTMRLYRSVAVDTATAQPNDELQLCYEARPTATDIASGYMAVTDTCPPSALGAGLYSNTLGGGDVLGGAVRPSSTTLGMAAANDRPPLAKDVATFADCVFYANIGTLQRLQLSLLAVGAGALAAGDVLSVDGTNYTAVAGAPASGLQFRVETGLGSVTVNIRQTAMNLCAAVSASHPTLTATYIGSDTSPGTIGRILFEKRRSDDVLPFNVTTTGAGTAFAPRIIDATYFTGPESSRDVQANGIAFSKPLQGDAVPPANYVTVGRNDTGIQRIIPLRDALYIFTDDGIFWCRGSIPADFVFEAFDTTFRVLSRDSVVAMGDAIYAWGREGVARITNGGVEYIDLPVRNFVQACQGGLDGAVTLTDFARRSFAVAYPVQRRVVFFFPGGAEASGESCNRALVYHAMTDAWSTYSYANGGSAANNGKLCGVVRWSDEVLVAGEVPVSTLSYMYLERALGIVNDYRDATDVGGSAGIASTLRWQALIERPDVTCHWSELQVYLTPDAANAALAPPLALDVSVTAEHGGTMSSTLAINSAAFTATRLLLTPDVGIAARQVVTVAHAASSQYFATSGFALLYRPMSSFLVR